MRSNAKRADWYKHPVLVFIVLLIVFTTHEFIKFNQIFILKSARHHSSIEYSIYHFI